MTEMTWTGFPDEPDEPEKFIATVKKMSEPKQRVNVLYLNTACNLKCDYCYELDGRNELKKQEKITRRQGEDFFKEIAEREKGLVSTVVIMGGEVFLEKQLLLQVLEYANRLDHQFAISLVTNGTMFRTLPGLKSITELITTLEISYDGSGQDRRIWHNGKSCKGTVESNLRMLKEWGIDFKISYTVHKDNYKNLLYDMVRIMEVFKPYQIKLSFACQELEDAGVDFVKFRQDFLQYAEQLYMSYGIAICDLSCALCNRCAKSHFEGTNYYSPTKGQILEDAKTEHKFKSF